MKKLVVLTGAGISAESGIKTFREMGGLWEEYDVMEVASPRGWERNMNLVLRFYNERRKQLKNVEPNNGHKELVELEKFFDVQIITQNVDDLHERAGSTNVLHLHGELKKARSTVDPELIYEIEGYELKRGDTCEMGSQLRPHVVWFGEPVPAIEEAAEIAKQADIFAAIGTSMFVYPAAGLIDFVPAKSPTYVIDPNDIQVYLSRKVEHIKEKASTGVEKLKDMLVDEIK